MPTDEAVFWHDLASRDRQVHAQEAARALVLENEQLRLRNAELSAALLQAREAITLRHRIMEDQSVALAERDHLLAEARSRAAEAEAALDAVLSSRRWRAGDVAGRVATKPRALLARLRKSR